MLALADDLLDLLAHGLLADAERLQRLGRDAFALVDEAEQDVLGADVVVVEHPGLFLSQDHNPPRPVGEPLEHLVAPHRAAGEATEVLLVPSAWRPARRATLRMRHVAHVTRSPSAGRSPTSNLRPGAVFPATPGANARRASERAAYSVQISQRRAAGMRCAAGQLTELRADCAADGHGGQARARQRA